MLSMCQILLTTEIRYSLYNIMILTMYLLLSPQDGCHLLKCSLYIMFIPVVLQN